MASPSAETIAVRFTPEEHQLIEDLAAARRMTTSDVVRELMGFEREDERTRHTGPNPPGGLCLIEPIRRRASPALSTSPRATAIDIRGGPDTSGLWKRNGRPSSRQDSPL